MTRPSLLQLDANIPIAHLRRRPEAERRLVAHPPVTLAISAVTLFEIEGDVPLTRDPELERCHIACVLGVIALLPFDAEAARQAAVARADLERTGSPIGPYDTLLAGHAMALGAGVATDNQREFKRVKGLHVEPWRFYSDQSTCETAATQAANEMVSAWRAGATANTIQLRDATGQHTYGGPNQRP